jgi:hypothetical protein
MENWISVFKSNDENKVRLIQLNLENVNIQSVVFNKVDHLYPFLGNAEIKVPAESADKASEIIKELN